MTYLEVVQYTGALQEKIAPILELPWLLARSGLPKCYLPLPLLLVPIATGDSSVEGHVLPQIECVANLVEILPDVRALLCGQPTIEGRSVRVSYAVHT